MEFDLQWLLIGLPITFALGWMASRVDLRQLRRDNRDAPRAYFKGLNLLLNEQQDKAIDAFIEAVQHDPDTTELHFALGNLFRRRGEFERSVRVHQHLLARADLKAGDSARAQHALAQDYMKAGLFDRAEGAFEALADTPFSGEAQLALLSLHERSRDWPRAVEVAKRLDQAGGGSFASRIAHYECERVLDADAAGRSSEGDAALRRARTAAPQAPRPLLLAGQRHAALGEHGAAVDCWDALRERDPAVFVLVADAYADAANASGRSEAARGALLALYAMQPALDLLQALERLEGEPPTATEARRLAHLQNHHTLSAAHQVLLLEPERWLAAPPAALRDAVGRAAGPLQRYRCAACGFEARHHFWQCPGCLAWDSYPTRRIEDL